MRLIKLAIISIIAFSILITLISLLFPTHIRISKAINLPQKKDSIFSLLANQEQWPRWHPGFGNAEGVKEMTDLKKTVITQNDSTFIMQLQLPGKKPVINGWQVYGTPQSDSLTLQWYMDFNVGWYPWQRFGSLFYEGTYGVAMQKGLHAIKTVLVK